MMRASSSRAGRLLVSAMVEVAANRGKGDLLEGQDGILSGQGAVAAERRPAYWKRTGCHPAREEKASRAEHRLLPDHQEVLEHMPIQTFLDHLILLTPPQPGPDRSTLCDLCSDLHGAEMLRLQNVELRAHVAELEAFAHTVAHDIKGSLGPIIGFASVLRDDDARLTVQDRQKCLDSLVYAGHKLSCIVDELLLLAEMRETEVVMEPLCTAPIVAEALGRLAFMIHDYGAEIVLPSSWPVAVGHGPWVEEVWVNYISNAIKYGGRPPRVELNAAAQLDGTVCFWVRDNGPGIALDDQARLFKPFTRLGLARADGHGLGLSVVQHIVEKLGGEVGVCSAPGQGSVFSFTLHGCSPHILLGEACCGERRPLD